MNVDVPFLDSRSWEEGAMRERMRWLRDHSPVHWSEPDGLWVVSRFADVVHVSKHQELFTSGQGVRPGNPVKIGLIDEEEPRHGRLRGLLNKGFTPRMVKRLEEVFTRITADAIDAVVADGECDFVEAISVPLPLRLIAAMIGIRDEDYDHFHEWSDAMIAAEGNFADPEIMARAGQAFLEYAAYVTEVIEDRRRDPQDDLVSILVGAKDQGLLETYDEGAFTQAFGDAAEAPALQNDELIKLLVILMVAGNETTRNGLSGGIQLLIEHPEARQRLIDDPSLIPAAVEEMLRLVSPVRNFGRTAVQNTELRGEKIEAGQQVLVLYPSANRDEREFPDPDRFIVDRNPHHVAFGIGSHFCMGANLARMEMRVAIREVLRRMPNLEYAADGPVLQNSALVRTCSEMRVRFTPGG
ncbi:MAG: cytochrome P450 [Myxococcota bacterium]